MRFSQRIGSRPVKTEFEKEGLSDELRNSLWTLVLELVIDKLNNEYKFDQYRNRIKYTELTVYYRALWMHFYKRPIDSLPTIEGQVNASHANDVVRQWFFTSDWDLVLDFIEFNSSFHVSFQEVANMYLKQEMSAYRFIDGNLVEVNSKEEIQEIEDTIKNSNKFQSVKEHLKRAIELYSDRKNPDYRNSIKESISAVESLAKILISDDKTTLGQALKVIEQKHKIPGSLKDAFSTLYGYTSHEGGIRHSLLERGVKVEIEEARFMLIACSAFVNYLISKK